MHFISSLRKAKPDRYIGATLQVLLAAAILDPGHSFLSLKPSPAICSIEQLNG